MSDSSCKSEIDRISDLLKSSYATRSELGEHEVMLAKQSQRLQKLENESRDHRDRDIKMMGVLRAVGESLDANTKASQTMKRQINKLFALMKGKTNAGSSKPKP